eukprot:1388689-Rhodomonas_salina.1
MPSESGVTSTSTSADVAPLLQVPDRIEPWTAAPTATASSGLMLLHNSFPPKCSYSMAWIFGMSVDPPTRTMSRTSAGVTLASFMTDLTVSMHLMK